MKTKWINRKCISIQREELLALASQHNITPELAMIIKKREIEDIGTYFNPEYRHCHNPLLLKDIEQGVAIITEHIKNKNLICIVNDYDVDGATSGMIMRDAIHYLGGNCIIITPNRITDGYGISKRIVDCCHDKNCSLIVTTDNGIAASEQIEYARQLGIDVVITDHHEVPYIESNNIKQYQIPNANAVINPKQMDCKYPFKEICGAAVAYKVVEVLIHKLDIDENRFKELSANPNMDQTQRKSMLLKRMIELVAIGTICDVMPLNDENRVYTKLGLELLKNSSFIGLRQLMHIHNILPETLNSYHIGYVLGPCINATGRLTGTVDEAIQLLLEKDQDKALKLAEKLKVYNEERKQQSVQGEEIALSMIQEISEKDNIYLLYIPNINPAICGIIAGHLKERTGHPVVICSDDQDGLIKGSGRSVPGYNIFEEFSKHKELLEKFGGHELACGLTITRENFQKLNSMINEEAKDLDKEIFHPVKWIDIYIAMEYISKQFVMDLSKMEPFGKGNEKPLIAVENARICKMSKFGQNNQYRKLYIATKKGGVIEGIYFGNAEELEKDIKSYYGIQALEKLYKGYGDNIVLNLLYTPKINVWNNQETLQFIINEYQKGENIV